MFFLDQLDDHIASKTEDMDGVLYKNTTVETRIVAGLFFFSQL